VRSGRRRPTGRGPVATTPWWAGPLPVAGILVVVLLAVVLFIFLGRSQPPPPHSAATDGQVLAMIASLDVQGTEAVGASGIKNPLQPVKGVPPLTGAGGKLEVLYIGAEFCPFCAAERWSLAVALGRFGTLSGVGLTTSSSSDVFPDTPTFTFLKATYASDVLAFASVEETDRDRNPLQTPTADQQRLFEQLNAQRSIPFVDLGNRYVAVGSGFQPDVLAGQTWLQVATELRDNPRGPTAGPILGNANWITAGICQGLANPPLATCGGPEISALRSQLGTSG
jgi:thiol-disulfide isomerase/thioredoxin